MAMKPSSSYNPKLPAITSEEYSKVIVSSESSPGLSCVRVRFRTTYGSTIRVDVPYTIIDALSFGGALHLLAYALEYGEVIPDDPIIKEVDYSGLWSSSSANLVMSKQDQFCALLGGPRHGEVIAKDGPVVVMTSGIPLNYASPTPSWTKESVPFTPENYYLEVVKFFFKKGTTLEAYVYRHESLPCHEVSDMLTGTLDEVPILRLIPVYHYLWRTL